MINDESSIIVISLQLNKSSKLVQKLITFKFNFRGKAYGNKSVTRSPLQYNSGATMTFFHNRDVYIINDKTFPAIGRKTKLCFWIILHKIEILI